MIKANELKIWNWVQCYGNLIQIGNIHPKGTIVGDEPYSISELDPIPLTEEILLKCGFEQDGDNDYLQLYINDALNILWLGYLSIEVNGYFVALSEKEQLYLHQLQNIYFALTGEELEVNL